jgi:hypothetical protein
VKWYLYAAIEDAGLRFELPYQERLMRVGKQLGRRLHEHGISWWDEQLEEYDLLLEEQAFPFEEKAIDIHLANFRRIPAGTYDEPTRKSLQVLGEMMPFRYARVESSDSHVEIQ